MLCHWQLTCNFAIWIGFSFLQESNVSFLEVLCLDYCQSDNTLIDKTNAIVCNYLTVKCNSVRWRNVHKWSELPFWSPRNFTGPYGNQMSSKTKMRINRTYRVWVENTCELFVFDLKLEFNYNTMAQSNFFDLTVRLGCKWSSQRTWNHQDISRRIYLLNEFWIWVAAK